MTQGRAKLHYEGPEGPLCWWDYEGPDYEGPEGTLCSWDGGAQRARLGASATECWDCHQVVVHLWKMWHPKLPCPSRYQMPSRPV